MFSLFVGDPGVVYDSGTDLTQGMSRFPCTSWLPLRWCRKGFLGLGHAEMEIVSPKSIPSNIGLADAWKIKQVEKHRETPQGITRIVLNCAAWPI